MSDETVTFKTRGVSNTGEVLLGSIEVQAVMQEMVNDYEKCIAELKEKLFTQSQESKEAVERAIEIILEKDKRIVELKIGLELAIPVLNSARKQHWDGVFNAWDICNNLVTGGEL